MPLQLGTRTICGWPAAIEKVPMVGVSNYHLDKIDLNRQSSLTHLTSFEPIALDNVLQSAVMRFHIEITPLIQPIKALIPDDAKSVIKL